MNDRRSQIFWDIVEVLRQSALLPHVMIIGSWAEYLYPYYFGGNFTPNLKTHDIDVFYGNPFLEIPGAENLRENFRRLGFVPCQNFSEAGTFFKDGIEVEFLSAQMGTGPGLVELSSTGIMAEKLKDLDMLRPVLIEARGYEIRVPTPSSYIAHKLYINPERRPAEKRPKDIEAVRGLLLTLRQQPSEAKLLRQYIESLPDDKQARIRDVVQKNALDLGI